MSATQVKASGTSFHGRIRPRTAPSAQESGGLEQEARLAGVPGGREGPVRIAEVSKLVGGFEPTQQVEVEIVAAGGSEDQHGNDGEKGRKAQHPRRRERIGGWMRASFIFAFPEMGLEAGHVPKWECLPMLFRNVITKGPHLK